MESKKLYYLLSISLFIILFTSCKDVSTQSDLDDSLETVEEVTVISGTSNTIITVNKSNESFFRLDFSGINTNDIITNGEKEGWCIDWQKPIDSSGGTYEDIQLYSTYNVESWKSINYLFNNLDYLRDEIPGLTNIEIQLVIWSLRGNPEFDLNQVQLSDLPSRMYTNEEILFNQEVVSATLQKIEDNYRDFNYEDNSRFAVIAETPVDVQTVITVVEK
ncbi:hypothetical protein [Rhodohalobacter barkolensis]|uniref:Uncharacterized protein n=1 Tax=Rhodohalobacter barkolensis TaxID=2053187 RepID=A0A2N0VGL3_9BACT|nr:hypothetical protein [Rhodohalobacter barkolensis]PKD43288.1 hypothetical protein CWD77_11780 [Rhodohalobacter barkolensis]